MDIADRERLREKYAQEREKRLRSDGIDQYVSPYGIIESIEGDPYTDVPAREPLTDHVEFLFVGGGFAGITVCAKLKESGIDSFRIIEAGGDFGGVWYWNRYPGARCDTAAMVYLPLLEETGHIPSAKYVKGPEILEHAQRIARHYDLYPHAVFGTHIKAMAWDDNAGNWIVETAQGDRFTATHIAMGTGPLNRPKLPGVPGLTEFRGNAFHTARWRFDITGGDWGDAPMDKLADKRVGIIGTGATAIQCITPLGRDSGELYVFQRTPSAIDVRGQQPIAPDWFRSLEPGWQRIWERNFMQLQSTGLADVDLVQDGWTDHAKGYVSKLLSFGIPLEELTLDDVMRAYEEADDENMERVRARVDEVIDDPATAAKLKAWYRQYCKRPCFDDEYLPTFNRPNVHLVDTDGKGVERIDETGVWANGEHYELDVLIYASGFEFNSDYSYRSGFEVTGRDGLTLTDAWADGMQTLHGMFVHGFPNMFIVGIIQGSFLASNITSNYPPQGVTLAALLNHMSQTGASRVETSQEAQDSWVELLLTAPPTIVGGPDCTPGYYNSEGQVEGRKERLNLGRYPAGPMAFFDHIDRWRSSGSFEGLIFDGQTIGG